MIISEYEINIDFYDIISGLDNSLGEPIATGEHSLVLQSIQQMLASSTVDGDSDIEFTPVNEYGEIATIESEKTWLLIEVIPLVHARIIKNPVGKTETIHRTCKGSLMEVINALYAYIVEIDNQ